VKKWKRRGTRAGKQRNFASANGFLEFLMCLGDRYNQHYYYERRKRGRIRNERENGRGRGKGIRGNERENERGRGRGKERENSQSNLIFLYLFYRSNNHKDVIYLLSLISDI